MIMAEIVTLLIYIISMAFLPEYFGQFPDKSGPCRCTNISIRPVIRYIYHVRMEGRLDCGCQLIPARNHPTNT